MSQNVSSPKAAAPVPAASSLPPYTIEVWPIGRLKAYERNARKHSPAQVRQLKDSFEKFGQVWPILVREDGTIIAGHGRLEAAKAVGLAEILVIVANGWSEEQCRAFGILDNKVALNSEWDEALLGAELADLAGFGVDLAMLGFDPQELAALSPTGGHTGLTDPDVAPEPPANPVAIRGDLWALGPHRLLCGDCTQPEDVARLMDGAKAVLMNTDPPYGVDYAGVKNGIPRSGFKDIQARGGDIENDDLTDGVALQAFLEAAIRTAVPHLIERAAFYLWHPMLTQGTFFAAAAAAAADILIHRQIIWVKPHLVLTRSGMYHWKHELCFYGWRRGFKPAWYGNKGQTSVWEIPFDGGDRHHPTQKPTTLFEAPILNHSKTGEIVYEPFSGSGSQIITAQKTDRVCRAIEIAPKYIDAAVIRWQDFTGQKATLDGDGRTFDEIAAERLPAAA